MPTERQRSLAISAVVAPSAASRRASSSRAVNGFFTVLSAAKASSGSITFLPLATRRTASAMNSGATSRTTNPVACAATARRRLAGSRCSPMISDRQDGSSACRARAAANPSAPGRAAARTATSGRNASDADTTWSPRRSSAITSISPAQVRKATSPARIKDVCSAMSVLIIPVSSVHSCRPCSGGGLACQVTRPYERPSFSRSGTLSSIKDAIQRVTVEAHRVIGESTDRVTEDQPRPPSATPAVRAACVATGGHLPLRTDRPGCGAGHVGPVERIFRPPRGGRRSTVNRRDSSSGV